MEMTFAEAAPHMGRKVSARCKQHWLLRVSGDMQWVTDSQDSLKSVQQFLEWQVDETTKSRFAHWAKVSGDAQMTGLELALASLEGISKTGKTMKAATKQWLESRAAQGGEALGKKITPRLLGSRILHIICDNNICYRLFAERKGMLRHFRAAHRGADLEGR
jgi:hypothetical protein